MKTSAFLARVSLTAILAGGLASYAAAQDMRKDATEATKAANAELLNQLPFSDTSDFDDAKRGLIAPLPTEMIQGQGGNAIWNPQQYSFITEGAPAPDTVNPSLWRQSQLINISGLFEVTDGIYQIRNLDLSNMTIIEGSEGITVVDPLVSEETAKVGMDLYYKHRGQKPVKAVIYTHSHVDHYGGVRGVVSEDDVRSGKAKIYAPDGFLEAAVAENVMAGTAMSRRASYMYGNLLPPDPKGQVGAGLGTTTSAGTVTLIPPTDIISETGHKETIDGLTYEFLMAPGSEAPAEMLWFIEEKRQYPPPRMRRIRCTIPTPCAAPRFASLCRGQSTSTRHWSCGATRLKCCLPSITGQPGARRTLTNFSKSSATSIATSTMKPSAWSIRG